MTHFVFVTGSYICTFTEIVNHMPIVYRAEGNLIVSKINVIPSKNTVIVCDGERKELSCCTDNDIQWFSTQWKPNGAINISGMKENHFSWLFAVAKPFSFPTVFLYIVFFWFYLLSHAVMLCMWGCLWSCYGSFSSCCT